MLFHSPGFLFVFLPVFLAFFLLAPAGNIRAAVLLSFSYLFYSGAEPFFVLILITSSLTDYSVALRLSNSTAAATRRMWLATSLTVNLGLLFFFKYGGWIIPQAAPFLTSIHIPTPSRDFFQSYALPAGISFYTFQSLSYTIDVYRGEIRPERSVLGFCNYVAYLPQLIAGPIERYAHLAPQLYRLSHARLDLHWSEGLDRVMLGIVQKLFLADACALIVDPLVSHGGEPDLITAWTIAVGFGMQIYFDFAAYTHMAIGISLILGVRLQENFLSPYKADSVRDFWRRWHVTLSNWFRDYVYIPLGGSRAGSIRTLFNLLVTFLLCGLWHGAGPNYIVWGALHGLMLAGYHLKSRYLASWTLPHPLAVGLTFAAVHFAWIPFRIADNYQMMEVWQGMLGLNGVSATLVGSFDIAFLVSLVVAVMALPNASQRWPGRSGWRESSALAALALFALFNSPNINSFIYFQF